MWYVTVIRVSLNVVVDLEKVKVNLGNTKLHGIKDENTYRVKGKLT